MTYIDGIGASENIDSSGERISIAGMDITSLALDGVFNWEHEQAKDPQGQQITVKMPSQIVGKVLKAKKIFSEKDCSDERETYFWQKCQTPYVYVMGELFDDYKDSAKDVAGMFRYDADKKGQNERNVMNFSIEGAKIEKKGIDVVRSIARKVTITVLPCNKVALAEMVPAQTNQPKDDIDSLFKTETSIEIELFKTKDIPKFMENLKKSATMSPVPPQEPDGKHIGRTKSGKDVFANKRVGQYEGFSSQDHRDAANLHHESIKEGMEHAKPNQFHAGKMKLHMQAAASAEKKENRFATAKRQSSQRSLASTTKPYVDIPGKNRGMPKSEDMQKALTAGSGMEAPSQLTGGAALAKESLKKGDPKTESAQGNKLWPQSNPSGNGSKQKGVHHEYDERGQSMAGMANAIPEHKQEAKQLHRNKLSELKSMPKPNLTKASEHEKGVHIPVKNNPGKSKSGVLNQLSQKHGGRKSLYALADNLKEHKKVITENRKIKPKLTKSEYWLERAEQEYQNWDKKELFINFMTERMPKMTKSEIDAFGRTIALKFSLKSEESLESLVKSEESDKKTHAKVGDVVHVHMPNEKEKIKGVVRSVHTKEMGMGGKELQPDDHMAHVEILENGRQAARHTKGFKYFAPAKYGKTGDNIHITPHDEKKK